MECAAMASTGNHVVPASEPGLIAAQLIANTPRSPNLVPRRRSA
jgi:hypothetical protein